MEREEERKREEDLLGRGNLVGFCFFFPSYIDGTKEKIV